MNIQCPKCKAFNYTGNILCSHCSNPLGTTNELSKKLLDRIDQLDRKYQAEIMTLRKSVSDLNHIKENQDQPEIIVADNIAPAVKVIRTKIEEQEVKKTVPLSTPTNKPKVLGVPETRAPYVKKVDVPTKPEEPSEFELKIKEFLTPLVEGLNFFTKAYDNYQKEGKLPIFFMTMAGIVAILFGFGYLMQLSFEYIGIYSEIVKIALGFGASTASILIGIRLTKKEGTLKEYGAALVSLGIILNYLMVYFLSDLGDFPVFSSGILGFTLITLNTVLSIFFALKYEAKVISVISLIGGSFAPLYLNATGDGRLYFLYIWLLAIGSSYVAKKIDWKTLKFLTFAVAIGSLQFMVFTQEPTHIIYTVYYHLFAYLFFFLTLFDGLKLKNTLLKEDIILLAGNISFLLYNLYFAFADNLITLGLIYIANGLVFASLLFVKWKELNRDNKIVLFVIIGTLLGFAIPSIFDQNFMGLFWSIEASILVVLGFHFSMIRVRREGYFLLALAIGKLLISSSEILSNWNSNIWHDGFVNYIALGAVISFLWYIGKRYKDKLIGFENGLYSFTKEFVPIWLNTVFFIIGYQLLSEWIFTLMFIPLLGLIYWKKQLKTKYSDLVGLAHLPLFVLAYTLSMQQSNSVHFSDQYLYAQITIAQFVVILWSLKLYYQTIKLEGEDTFQFTQYLRIAFFCLLPLIVINLVRKNAFEFIEISVWAGAAISYLLFKKLKFSALNIEFHMLSLAGFGICFMEIDPIGMIVGIVLLGGVIFAEKAIDYTNLQESQFKGYLNFGPYFMVFLVASFILSFGDSNFSLALSVSSLLLFAMVYFYDTFGPIQDSKNTARILASIINLVSLLALIFFSSVPSMIISIANLVVFSVLLDNKNNWFSKLYNGSWNASMILHQLQTIIIYLFLIDFFNGEIDGPVTSILLVLHAIIILFVAMKNKIGVLNKMSIVLFSAALLKLFVNDVRDFSTGKIVVVILILGVSLLAGAYGYVQLSKYFESNLDSEPTEGETEK